VGLPGTSGFIGEFLAIFGIFKVNNFAAILAATGVIFGAIYMLKLYRKIMFGHITDTAILNFQDLQSYEILALTPLVVLTIYLGLLPGVVMERLTASVLSILKLYN
jgi:NADH-quinone oxidoreductase subunit M